VSKSKIKTIRTRRVWTSRGQATLEVEAGLRYGGTGRAIAPIGQSIASGEAVSIQVESGEAAIEEIASHLKGRDATDQESIDKALIDLDGTADKSRLGGNTLIATSIAVARAAASARRVALWRHLSEIDAAPYMPPPFMPMPHVQVFGGGIHAEGHLDIQDVMAVPAGADNYAQALEWCAAITAKARDIMNDAGKLRGVTPQGGLWPAFKRNEEALETMLRAIEGAGLRPGKDVGISLDLAASQLGQKGKYRLALDNKNIDSDALSGTLVDWIERYPIIAVEDPLSEGDKEGMVRFTWAVGKRVQVSGDDFLVTNAARIRAAARARACNAVSISPSQAGTLSETLAAVRAARKAGFGLIAQARSGDSEDTAIVELCIAWGLGQLKAGGLSRGERTAKWNQGLRIAEALGEGGKLPPASSFAWRSLGGAR